MKKEEIISALKELRDNLDAWARIEPEETENYVFDMGVKHGTEGAYGYAAFKLSKLINQIENKH